MVLRGMVEAPKSMATSPIRSNPLHNFTLPSLKWGTRSTNDAGAGVSGSGDQRSSSSSWKSDESKDDRKQVGNARGLKRRRYGDDGEDEIAAMRQKLMVELKNDADRLKDALLKNLVDQNEQEQRVLPWNLRKRPAECKAAELNIHNDENKRNCSSAVRFLKLKSNSDMAQRVVKLTVELTEKEVAEDFMEILGRQPPRRPIKRRRVVQKNLDTLFPGLCLTNVTADKYKVVEAKENGKVHVVQQMHGPMMDRPTRIKRRPSHLVDYV